MASEAGYTPGAVYTYFENRDELVLELLAQDLQTLTRKIGQADPKDEKPIERISVLFTTLIDQAQEENIFQSLAPLLDETSNPAASETGRLITGKILQLLNTLSTPLQETFGSTAETNKRTVALASMALGLSLLEKSGRLNVLGFESGEIISQILQDLVKE